MLERDPQKWDPVLLRDKHEMGLRGDHAQQGDKSVM